MKKKILLCVFLLMSIFCLNVVKAKDKVKVYIFEAGGCPWCEREIEYLKGLDSYGEKFEIVTKELYVDHETWAHGKDYDLGVKVANYFTSKGFENASAQGTPFVVISDVYAATTYNTDLENVIDEAYDKGDQDIVATFEEGKETKENNYLAIILIFVVLIGGIASLVVIANHDSKENK